MLLVWGLVRADDPAGRVLLICGMALGSLGGLETALREHFAGTRSHAAVLAGVPAVAAAGVLFFARAPWVLVPVCAAAVFAAAFARAAPRAPAGRSARASRLTRRWPPSRSACSSAGCTTSPRSAATWSAPSPSTAT